jgi:polyisoprenyl-phosphate glycosyltransferase
MESLYKVKKLRRGSLLKNMISVIVPCYNEEQVIKETYKRLTLVFKRLSKYDYQLVFVNDGSKDKTVEILKLLAQTDRHIKVVDFSRNFGHQIAVTAGIDHADGEAVVLIDADLQDPPELILEFVKKWEEGYDVVYAVRRKREGESLFKKVTAKYFYRILRKVTDVEIPLDTGDFRLMDRKVVNVLKAIKERNRFIRGLVSWVGFKQIGIKYDRAERYDGETKYPLKKMIRFSVDAITSFSFVPLRVASMLGIISSSFGLLGIIIALYLRLCTGVTLPGWTSLMIVVLFLGGLQLFILGVIGEYLGRVYDETRNRPLYIVGEIIQSNKNVDNIGEIVS